MIEARVTFFECAGWLHLPDDQRRRVALVLCPPFGAEWLWVYRTYRRLAQALCAQGFVVLRFDYLGTGDSLGDESQTGGSRAWIDSIHAATDMLKTTVGVESFAYFGLRLGGTLAAAAAAERSDVESLVLWAPYASGKQFLREAKAFSALRDAPVDEVLSVGGFVVSPELDASLRTLALPKVIPGCRQMFLLKRDDLATDATLEEHYGSQMDDVTSSDVGGYERMMRDAYDSVPPLDAIAEITTWMLLRHTAFAGGVPNAPVEESLVGDGFVEESRRFGDDNRIFGVLTTPIAPSRPRGFVILPNVGSNHHIGPARLMVTLARTLARSGHTVLRFDVGGIGDSLPAAGMSENTLYAEEAQQDARAAMDYLDAQFAPGAYAFAGVCSGAYLSYHTAVADARVSTLILINILTFHWHPGDTVEAYIQRQYKGSSYYFRAWRDPDVWRRAFHGDVNARGIMWSLLRRMLARGLAFLLRRITGTNSEVHGAFKRLALRGTRAFFVFGADDAGLDEVEREMRMPARQIGRMPGVNLAIVHGADHAFTVPPARADLIQQVQQFLHDHGAVR